MVKDLRTGVEKGAQGVLDGDIDAFLEASLAQGFGGKEPAAAVRRFARCARALAS